MTSKRSVSTSAMVDLKAELHRKQEEFRRQKVDHGQNIKGRKLEKIKTKKSIWNQQNRGVIERSSRDIEEKAEEEDDLVKSRRMLAHKTKLYNEMASTSNIPDEDGSEGFLVDFQRKAVDRMVEEREKQRKEEEERREEEAEKKALAEPIPEPVDSDEEWVDFTDSFGRSRRCMKKDLAMMNKNEQDLKRDIKSKDSTGDKGDVSEKGKSGPDLPDLMSSDMHREKMRQKWEEEERALIDKGQEEIHYSNVQFDEIRSHGVGYYQFSKDHEARQEQMEQLKKLREETEKETSRKDRIQAKRKAMMEARLAKVRDRRKLKEVPSTDGKSEEEKSQANDAILAKQKAEEEEERRKKEESEKEAMEVRKNHIREWDKEKQKNSWSGKGYFDSRRSEREAEFAPPSIYFDNSRSKVKSNNVSNEVRINRLKQSTQSHGINSEFAPPAFYHDQDKKICDETQQKSKKSDTFTSSHSSDGSDMSHRLLVKDNPDTNPSVINDVLLESIPLPASNAENAGNAECRDLHSQNVLLTSSVEMNSLQHGLEKHHSVESYGNELHFPYVHHQQQHHQQHYQQQQYQQQQQQFYQQHEGNNHYHTQHDDKTYEAWMAYQQQQHPHSQNQEQPGFSSSQPQPQTVQKSQKQPLHQLPKRPPPSDNSQNISTITKPKVPKTAIMDTRFMLNDLPATKQDSDSLSTDNRSNSPIIEAVPYEPGSFTAARFPKGVSSEVSQGVKLHGTTTTQIAGGPQLYSKEQLEEQQKQLDEVNEAEDEDEADQKLNDFLASIRSETK